MKQRLSVATVMLGGVLCLSGSARQIEAQVPPIANVPGYNPVIYGLPVSCNDNNGMPVRFIFANVNDIAKSGMDQLGPLMAFSPAAQNASPPLLIFFYAHECMHHALGHISMTYVQHIAPPPTLEVDADCAAAKLVRNQNLLTLQQIQMVASTLVNNPPMGPYPAGPNRAQNIVDCYMAP